MNMRRVSAYAVARLPEAGHEAAMGVSRKDSYRYHDDVISKAKQKFLVELIDTVLAQHAL
jgi:hypothetical protein